MSIMTGPVTAPAAPPATAADEAVKSGGQQRLLLLGGAGLALIVVAALAYFFLLSGSDDTVSGPSVALPAPHSSASPSTAAPAEKPLRTFAGRTSRNPFKSLAPAQGAGSADAGTSTGTGTSTDSGTSTTPVSTAPPTSSVLLAVVLKSINSDKSGATLTVKPQGKATKTYTPAIGATFATYFQLNGFLSDAKTGVAQCAILSYGDASFTLCKGATLTIK